MKKLKKLSLLFLSIALCIAMYGCADGNSSKSDAQESVRAELADAINQYNSMTFEHYVEAINVSDPSMWYKDAAETYGEELTSLQWVGDVIYEIKDKNGVATDYKTLKQAYTKTRSFKDGTTKQKYFYRTGDGYDYEQYYEGAKTKQKFSPYFESVDFDILTLDHVENITLTDDSLHKTFNFDFKKDRILARWVSGYEREDSDVVLDTFSGALTISKNDGSINFIWTLVYKDKNTGATLTHTYTGEFSNQIKDLNFPSDLADYKEEA